MSYVVKEHYLRYILKGRNFKQRSRKVYKKGKMEILQIKN